jgi:TetR/AcrR family transcriptional regulator
MKNALSPVPAAAGARSILDAATALFANEGFDAVSIASIADKAGVCKANVFHHFPSKDDLYLAVMREASAAHADYAEQLFLTQGSSADKVRKLIEFEIHNFLDNRERTRLLLREAAGDGQARVRKLARDVFQRNFTAVVRIFEQGREQGEFRADIDPAAAAMLLGGATNFFFTWREPLRQMREVSGLESVATYTRRMAALILSGVLARPDGGTAVPRKRHRSKAAGD